MGSPGRKQYAADFNRKPLLSLLNTSEGLKLAQGVGPRVDLNSSPAQSSR